MKRVISTMIVLFVSAFVATAQTTEFTYQGNLKDGTNQANGNYDIEFRLFSIDTGGTAIGTLDRLAVPVSNGSFTVKLDFGAQFPGATRYLEIAVRPAGSGSFTTLSPRQQISNSPYSVRSLNAGNADNATTATNATNAANAATATNAQQLGGVAANQYVITGDTRLSDARNPLPGSANYVQNGTSAQIANFNITGSGTAAGTLSASIVNATGEFTIGGHRAFAQDSSLQSTYAGYGSGQVSNITGENNSFFGAFTGGSNTTGFYNSFFGTSAGSSNTTGNDNSFFGRGAGISNTTGGVNSFFGEGSGLDNDTGSANSFFGDGTGSHNTAGGNNSFFGYHAGVLNSTGGNNSFFGNLAGFTNTVGDHNTLLGNQSDVGSNSLVNSTAVGANARVDQSNSIVLGSINGVNAATADTRVGIGVTAPLFKLHIIDTSNTGLRVQTNAVGGTVASFGGNGAFQVDAPGTSGGRLNIAENGNVGIGTNAPHAKLQVVGGSIYVTNPNTLVITSPNGACWGITVNNSGALSTFPVSPCP